MYIFGKEASLLPCHFKQQQKSFKVCSIQWFSSMRMAASLFGVLQDVNVSWSICNAKQLNGISSRGSGCLVTMADTVGNSCQSLETKIHKRKLINWNNHFGEQIYLFIFYWSLFPKEYSFEILFYQANLNCQSRVLHKGGNIHKQGRVRFFVGLPSHCKGIEWIE